MTSNRTGQLGPDGLGASELAPAESAYLPARMHSSIEQQTYINLGRSGILSNAIQADIRYLIRAYEMVTNYGIFPSAAPEETLPAQVGAIFALYLLYFTQPTTSKKTPIRLTITSWQNLELLYKIGFEHDLTDLIFVVHKLRRQNAFVYVAQNDRSTEKLVGENPDLQEKTEKVLIRLENKLNSASLVPTDALLRDVSKLAATYHRVKANLASVSLARRSSHIVMRHLRKMKAPEMDPREARPVPAFLRQSGGYADSSKQSNAFSNPNRVTDMNYDSSSIVEMSSSKQSRGDVRDNEGTTALAEYEGSRSTAATHESPNNSHTEHEVVDDDNPKDPREHLPFIFPLSMLQASRSEFPVQIEEMVRNYHRGRMARYEFATAGGLPRNDYSFSGISLLGKRKKKTESAALTAKEKARLRRRLIKERTEKAQNNIDQEAERIREQSADIDDPSQDSSQQVTQE
ncbi:hypothetical protein BGX26_003364 [Mortierella sp. AD094]|nr:hypothetical protein BGX26_003364 [Mortierella sp. AD094]